MKNPQELPQDSTLGVSSKAGKFIGNKKIKRVKELEDKTVGGFAIVEVEYEDSTTEWISSPMLEKVVSDESCDASALRDKRVEPIVQEMLTLLRDWGVKLGELTYILSKLEQSLDYNSKQALLELWSKWMPKPLSLEDVDLVTIDRVLRSKQITLNDVLRDKK